MVRTSLVILSFLFSFTLNYASPIMDDCEEEYITNDIDFYCVNPFIQQGCREYETQCRMWCEDNVNLTIIDSNIGKVKFSLFPPPSHCCHKTYEASLYVIDEELCEGQKISECKHSMKSLFQCDSKNERENCTANCSEMIEFTFKYVFTSWYSLVIKPFRETNTLEECTTKKLFVETDYEKQLIGNAKLNITPHYKSESEELNVVLSGGGGGLHLAEEVKIFLGCGTEPNEFGDDVDQIKVFLTQENGLNSGECCYRNYSDVEKCGCFWNNELLMCTFFHVRPGNHCITVELHDPRCTRNTLWANISSCNWEYKYHCEEPESEETGVDNPWGSTVSRVRDGYNTLIWILTAGIVATIFVTMFICFYFKHYPKKVYRQYISCAPSYVQQLSVFKTLKILLIYPRDCQHFMNVMNCFRHLLQEFLNVEVYDMWDDENWESINEVGHHWILKHILDKNIKIIIMASQSSRMFEKALLNQKSIIYNDEPNSFDNMCLYSFKELLTIVRSSAENYSRFFVVRLDEPGCEENKFETITPCTVYTVPTHLKDLTLQLHNMDPGEIILNPEKTSKINLLTTSLLELKQFKLNNPNYLNDLISLVNADE